MRLSQSLPCLVTSLLIVFLISVTVPITAAAEGDWRENEIDPAEWDDGPELEGSPMDVPTPGDPVVLFTVRYTPNLGGSEVEGEVVIELFPEWVPITVDNFVGLVEQGFYDGIFFHRIIDDFVAQSGDPTCYTVGVYPATTLTCAEGGSGETIPLEHEDNMSHVDGCIGMARGLDPDSAESQFYICDTEQHQLDPENRDDEGYVTFGVVRNGMSHVRAIAAVPTSNAPLGGGALHLPPAPDRPVDEVHIVSIEMLGVVGNNSSVENETSLPESDSSGFLPAPLVTTLLGLLLATTRSRSPHQTRQNQFPNQSSN
uniref:peptidylprolyl isomerase n=1 Tax=uncultured marine group II/III euryarchaeote KM3_155_G07 TaxID=1457898 RepID=A0A075GKP9_9EURY|nr:peptidyl-prolyl cis-trans isomerase cyclophilin type (PPIA) [uncultured marine group II/III euryarchaeote KM3_155_G07]